MVARFIHLLTKEVRGLHQAAYVLALFTFGSQLLALVRDRILAHTFGAGSELDLYYTAFRLPDLLYVLFASILSIYVLIPFVSSYKEQDISQGKLFLSRVFTMFVLAYTGIAFIAMIAAPYIVETFFPGLAHESDMLVFLIRILLVQPLLLGISSLYSVVTQIEERFVVYAVSPLLYNVGIIVGIVVFYPFFGLPGLAYGVLLGALFHIMVQYPTIRKSTLRPSFTKNIDYRELFLVIRSSAARALTLSLHQIVLFALIALAGTMSVGSVAVFQFAFNLQSVPLSIIGVSYSVAAFPILAHLYAEKNMDLFRQNIITAVRHIVFWSLPAVALFVVIRAQFVRVVLGTGSFDWDDTRLTAAVLALFIFSLTAQAIHLLLTRALYASGISRAPFYITLASSVLALYGSFALYMCMLQKGALYTFLETTMRLQGVEGIEVLALPLGYSIALLMQSIFLLIYTEYRLKIGAVRLILPLIRSVVAAIIGGVVAYIILNIYVTEVEVNTLMTVLSQGLVAGIAGLSSIIGAHYLMRSEELTEVWNTIKRKISREKVIMPQDEDILSV